MDVDNLEPGDRFIDVISDRLSACKVFLAVIGPRWLNARRGLRRRLEQPDDFVRLEIVAALSRQIKIIPVLVAGAEMPKDDDLPQSIAGITSRQSISISDDRFRSDMMRLAEIIRSVLASAAAVDRKQERDTVEAAITADRDEKRERDNRFTRRSVLSATSVAAASGLTWGVVHFDPLGWGGDDPKFGQLPPAPIPHPSDAPASAAPEGQGPQTALAYPKSRGGSEPILKLADVYPRSGAKVTQAVKGFGKIVFHAVGSTGNTKGNSNPASAAVADTMAEDFRGAVGGAKPTFLFHLGDVIYYFGEAQYYADQFYRPYRHYPAPILAVAGNHDGAVAPGTGAVTLQAFLDNFCAQTSHVSASAPDDKWDRPAQVQPGVYFTFEAPFVRILAFYSNVLEGPGVISNTTGQFPQLDDTQLRYLETALSRVKADRFTGAVVVAVHHDIYSAASAHAGSPAMQADMDSIFEKTGVWPHAVLSGHSHNYQRFTRTVGSMQIPFVVAGNGGYGVARLFRSVTPPALPMPLSDKNVVLESYDDKQVGFLRLTADAKQLRIEYQPASTTAPADVVTVDLAARKLIS